MVRVVGMEGALWAGVGRNCNNGMNGFENENEAISRAWKCLFPYWISILGGAFKREKARKKEKKRRGGGGGGGFKRFR